MTRIFYFILILSGQIAFLGCSGSNTELRDKMEIEIKRYIILASKSKTGYSSFKLSSITPFVWDRFYIFDEYITEEDVKKISGVTFNGSSIPSGAKRILFINNLKVVGYVDYKPNELPWFFYVCGPSTQYVFNKKDDLFIIFKHCKSKPCVIALVPNRCKENFKNIYQPNK